MDIANTPKIHTLKLVAKEWNQVQLHNTNVDKLPNDGFQTASWKVKLPDLTGIQFFSQLFFREQVS